MDESLIPEDLRAAYREAKDADTVVGVAVAALIERIARAEQFHAAAQLGAESFLAQACYSDSRPHPAPAIARLMQDYAELVTATLRAEVQRVTAGLDMAVAENHEIAEANATLRAKVAALEAENGRLKAALTEWANSDSIEQSERASAAITRAQQPSPQEKEQS